MLPENQAVVSDHSAALPPVSAVASDVQTAVKVADTAAVVATAVAPEAVQQAPSGAETAALSIEELFRQITSAIPAVSSLSGFAIPAEVATHAGFAIWHGIQAIFHLGKAAQKASAVAKAQ